MTYLYITRHGETKWNLEGRFQGRGNSELTARGRQQAKSLGKVLDEAAIDLILTSPQQRARETAEIARADRNIPVLLLDSLMELDLGLWEGQSLAELKTREPDAYHAFWNDPFAFVPRNGESYLALISRMRDALDEIVALAEGKRALVVTHGMALMAIRHLITGQDFAEVLRQPVLAQSSVTRVFIEDPDEPVYRVEMIGDTSHFDVQELHSSSASVWNERARPLRQEASDETLGDQAARLLLAKKKTISTAESLTGGLLAASLITSELGVSAAFMEGYVTYSNEAKRRDLGVAQATLASHGAVSAETVKEMVLGCQAKSNTDFAVATTGIAGPTGGSEEKPVGLTYIGIYHQGAVEIFREIFQGDRGQIRQAAVDHSLHRLIEILQQS